MASKRSLRADIRLYRHAKALDVTGDDLMKSWWLLSRDMETLHARVAELESRASMDATEIACLKREKDAAAGAAVEARRRVAELEGVLRTCREAFASLPIDALGEGATAITAPNGEAGEMRWPIRDEIIDRISDALPTPTKEPGDE